MNYHSKGEAVFVQLCCVFGIEYNVDRYTTMDIVVRIMDYSGFLTYDDVRVMEVERFIQDQIHRVEANAVCSRDGLREFIEFAIEYDAYYELSDCLRTLNSLEYLNRREKKEYKRMIVDRRREDDWERF